MFEFMMSLMAMHKRDLSDCFLETGYYADEKANSYKDDEIIDVIQMYFHSFAFKLKSGRYLSARLYKPIWTKKRDLWKDVYRWHLDWNRITKVNDVKKYAIGKKINGILKHEHGEGDEFTYRVACDYAIVLENGGVLGSKSGNIYIEEEIVKKNIALYLKEKAEYDKQKNEVKKCL